VRKPGTSKLQAFNRGGGKKWGVSDADFEKILKQYNCINVKSWVSFSRYYENRSTGDDMINRAEETLQEGKWIPTAFHTIDKGNARGILGIRIEDFIQFLDYLVTVKDKMWIAGYITIYQYQQERNTTQVAVLDANESKIQLGLTWGTNATLYKEPLTLISEVPSNWEKVRVMVDGKEAAIVENQSGSAQYDVASASKTVILQKASPVTINNSQRITAGSVHLQLSPNPFYSAVTTRFYISGKNYVSLSVFDISGKEVAKLINNQLLYGDQRVLWEARSMPGGTYIQSLSVGKQTVNERIFHLK